PLVFIVRVVCVSVWVMTTVAPGTAAPVLSVTVPNIVAVESWACAASPQMATAIMSMSERKALFTVILLRKKNKTREGAQSVSVTSQSFPASAAHITLADLVLATRFCDFAEHSFALRTLSPGSLFMVNRLSSEVYKANQ